jgi:hypothetical protein
MDFKHKLSAEINKVKKMLRKEIINLHTQYKTDMEEAAEDDQTMYFRHGKIDRPYEIGIYKNILAYCQEIEEEINQIK